MHSKIEGGRQAKTWASHGVIWLAVLIRSGDIITDVLVARRWYRDEEWAKFWIQVSIFALTSLVGGIIGYTRHKYFEKMHEPKTSGMLGAAQLQMFVELYDTWLLGTKTTCLKLILQFAATTQSIPSSILQSYVGFNNNQWDELLFVSVSFSFVSTAITLVSAEKEQYLLRGLDKLPVFSIYSFVLFLFRCVELPARILTLTLFCAEFGWWILLVLGLDIIALRLIRASTAKRIETKKKRSRAALARSMEQLNRSVEDLRALDEALDDDFTGVDSLSSGVLTAYIVMWVFVYLDGVDAVPYLGLRMIEEAILTAIFVVVERNDLVNRFQSWMLIIVAVFMCVHLAYGALWVYYRSWATFLHPDRKPEAIQMKILKLTKEIGEQSPYHGGDGSVLGQGRAVNINQNAVLQSQSSFQVESPTARGGKHEDDTHSDIMKTRGQNADGDDRDRDEEEQEEEEEEEEEEEAIMFDQDSHNYPNNVAAEVVLVEEVIPVSAPPTNKRTQAVQYEWNDFSSSAPANAAADLIEMEPDVPDVAANPSALDLEQAGNNNNNNNNNNSNANNDANNNNNSNKNNENRACDVNQGCRVM